MTFTPINELPKPAQFLLDELEKEEEKEILLNNYMKEILETHPVTNLKSILREMKQEVGSYSKMKKAELISRIIALKKKGFPVPKVEKYVKPARKKVAKKTAAVQGPKNLVKGFGIKKPEPKKEQSLFTRNDFSIDNNPYVRDKELNEIIETPKTYGSQSDKLLQAVFNSPKKAELEKLIKTVAGSSKAETIKLLGKHFKFHKEDLQKLQKGDILSLYLQGKALYKDFFDSIDSYKRAAKSKDGITQTWAKINIPKMQAVVKYFRDVSGIDVKPEPKAPAPVQGPNAPAPNNGDKFTSMTKREYLKYLKGLPNKIPDPDNTEEVDVFLKAHEGLGYAWQFVQSGFEPKKNFKQALDFYNSKSKKDKLKILELYSIPQDKLKKINHPKGNKQGGMFKTEIVERAFNKPSEAEFKKLQKETKELYEEIDNRYTTKAKVLKTRSKESKKKATELYYDLEDKYWSLLEYGREPIEYKEFAKFRELLRKKGEI